ncbi:hypothetical protein M0R72_14500 [Candidatus Pacearchaeota archaeon]|jgi:hypothetical protein|nr:hypothetical protein [Candidatus Pacearchaeota archaeon]
MSSSISSSFSSSSSSSSFSADQTVLERISDWLRVQVASAVTVYRAKRVHWSDPLTADASAVVVQGEGRVLYEGSGDVVMEQAFEIAVAAIGSDSETDSSETRAGLLMSRIVEALGSDDACGGNAMYGGLAVGTVSPIADEAGHVTGKSLDLAVTYSHRASDPTVIGVR